MPGRKGGSHKYPSGRKSPHKHTVSGHKRRGKWVQPFDRGRGTRPLKVRRSRVVGGKGDLPTNELAFTVNFKYSDKPGDGESVIVIADAPGDKLDAKTYRRVLGEAFEEKVDTREPIEVDMIDPSLGAVLSFIGKAAKKAGAFGLKAIKKGAEVGAKYGIRAVKAGTRLGAKGARAAARGVKVGLTESSKLALYEIERARTRMLIRQCYSEDPIERRSARIALKRLFPDIYDICDFSR